MKGDKSICSLSEQVIIFPDRGIIKINNAHSKRAYGLFDTAVGAQIGEFVKGNDAEIEFNNLDSSMHYDVGVIEDMGDENPQFAMMWNDYMQDNMEEKFNTPHDLPVKYPCVYRVKYVGKNLDGVSDLISDNNESVGLTVKLFPRGNRPGLLEVHSFRMKNALIKSKIS